MSINSTANVRLDLNSGKRAGVVEVNGTNLANAVTAVAVTAGAMDTPVVSLTLLTHEVMVDGGARVTIPEETHAALVVLGWTPPPADEAAQAHELAVRLLANPIYHQITGLAEKRGLSIGGGEIQIEESDAFGKDTLRVRLICDLVPVKTPAEWAAEQGVHVMDPDGWRRHRALGPRSWDEPISLAEFRARLTSSTVGPLDGQKREASS